ncbi:hypothetical protein [Ensifer sp. ENS12]|uniref:hypothetical protein n=1 Tax=Ensifer sp. ENS12 TaxID=2854774 RepID=UPI001C441861|nr:hypothetical protein [Ensifer sp. ENS12]MBV7521154.1 hypothetical protein [Ensifer sp. ENS12]
MLNPILIGWQGSTADFRAEVCSRFLKHEERFGKIPRSDAQMDPVLGFIRHQMKWGGPMPSPRSVRQWLRAMTVHSEAPPTT